MSSPDYIVDICGVSGERGQPGTRDRDDADGGANFGAKHRPWLAVHWKCCNAYSRIYRNKQATAYEGRCPRCGTPVKATIGPGGTAARFFQAK